MILLSTVCLQKKKKEEALITQQNDIKNPKCTWFFHVFQYNVLTCLTLNVTFYF